MLNDADRIAIRKVLESGTTIAQRHEPPDNSAGEGRRMTLAATMGGRSGGRAVSVNGGRT